MIVIVEGIDRVGKTTLVKMFEKIGFYVFKDENYLKAFDFNYDFSMGKLDTTIALIKQLSKDKNIGRFEEIFLGGKDIEVDELTELDANIDVCYSLSTSGESNVYFNITSFIESDKTVIPQLIPEFK